MRTAYRVRFTNYKDGKGEWFYTNEQDAQNYAERFKKYGYTPVIEPIFFQEILEEVN